MTEIIKLGGGPNPPVILDPAQVIVNVHWPSEFTHISLATTIARDMLAGDTPIPCAENDQDLTCQPYWHAFFTQATYRYATSVHPEKRISGASGFRNDEWSDLDIAEMTVAGMPDLAAAVFNFDDFEIAAGTGGISPPGCGQSFGIRGSASLRWQALSGSDTGIPVPGIHPAPQPIFVGTTAATAELFGDVYTGASFCSVIPGAWAQIMAPCTGHEIGVEPPLANAQAYAEQEFPAEGVLAIHQGKAYRSMGLWASPGGGIRILCERSPEDDPEEGTD